MAQLKNQQVLRRSLLLVLWSSIFYIWLLLYSLLQKN